jgi:hypothetical protein
MGISAGSRGSAGVIQACDRRKHNNNNDNNNNKEDPLIEIVRTHHHKINSVILQTARRLKGELQRGTIQKK